MLAATCVPIVASVSESQAGMDSMRSVAPVLVDVEVAGPGPCMEPGDGFLGLKTFFKTRFISLMIDVKEKNTRLHKWSYKPTSFTW